MGMDCDASGRFLVWDVDGGFALVTSKVTKGFSQLSSFILTQIACL